MADALNKNSLKIILALVLLLAVFLLGFIPEWRQAREQSAAREKAEHALAVSRIVQELGSATIDARRGEYEPAREEASAFFTTAHSEIDRRDVSNLTGPQRDALAPLLAPRDELITLLARSDPASGDRLSTLYVSVRKALQ